MAIVVGGFVLANLFYLSVDERKSEIGLKKALGAKNSAILLQFLSEAVLLTLLGSLAGSVLLGLAAGAYPAWQAAHIEILEVLKTPG